MGVGPPAIARFQDVLLRGEFRPHRFTEQAFEASNERP